MDNAGCCYLRDYLSEDFHGKSLKGFPSLFIFLNYLYLVVVNGVMILKSAITTLFRLYSRLSLKFKRYRRPSFTVIWRYTKTYTYIVHYLQNHYQISILDTNRDPIINFGIHALYIHIPTETSISNLKTPALYLYPI